MNHFRQAFLHIFIWIWNKDTHSKSENNMTKIQTKFCEYLEKRQINWKLNWDYLPVCMRRNLKKEPKMKSVNYLTVDKLFN